MPTTPVYAIPYPSLTDAPNGAAQMQALAVAVEAALASLPQGFISTVDKTLTTAIGTSMTDLIVLTFPVVAGRQYEIKGFGNGTQTTNTSTSRFQIIDDQSGTQLIGYNAALAAGGVLLGGAPSHIFQATTTRSCTVKLQAAASASTFTVGTGHAAGWLAAYDVAV